MPKKKRRMKNELIGDMMPPFILAGGATGLGILGGSLDSVIPEGMANPLTSAGGTLSHFVAPATAISGGTIVLKQIKKINPKKMKGGNLI